jgi:hypothetical protein
MADDRGNSREVRLPAFLAYDDVSFKYRRTVVIGEGTTEDDLKAFLKSLVDTPQLPASVRREAAAALGVKVRAQHRDYEAGFAAAVERRIQETQAQIRTEVAEGKRKEPYEGYRQAALDEIAAVFGYNITDSLKQRLKRNRRRLRKSRGTGLQS